jgi:hypothetical protein
MTLTIENDATLVAACALGRRADAECASRFQAGIRRVSFEDA